MGDLTTFLLHLNTTPHTQYASMNKLTLRNLTPQTKNSNTRGCRVLLLLECYRCWYPTEPAKGMGQMYNLLAFRFPEDITDQSERIRERLHLFLCVLHKSGTEGNQCTTSVLFSLFISLLPSGYFWAFTKIQSHIHLKRTKEKIIYCENYVSDKFWIMIIMLIQFQMCTCQLK